LTLLQHFYAATYTPSDPTATGSGLADNGEDIEVLDCLSLMPSR
jgi:hypothetical protein